MEMRAVFYANVWARRARQALPPPLAGRGIAYGFEASIALEDKTDSEDDSRIMEGVGWASSRRFSGGWRTRAQTMRDTNRWRGCSSRRCHCWAGRRRAVGWRRTD